MSYDYLPKSHIPLRQVKGMFKMNSDTVLLGEFLRVYDNETVLDIGTNNGALLLYASQYPFKQLIGVDIFQEAIDVAKENLQHYRNQCTFYCCLIQQVMIDKVDVIVCNPPYFNDDNEVNLNKNKFLKAARHEVNLPLNDLFSSFKRLISDNGRIYMVHRANRLIELVCEAEKNKLAIRTLQFVYDDHKEHAISVLIEMVNGQKSDVKIKKAIVKERG